jgi:CubicO group peptidase (beta-lactamase class C family)
MHRAIVFLIALTAFAQQPALEGIDTFITSAMKDWKVPGAAVAVVQDGKVVISKGYGLRDIKKELPVTPQTLFAIGSITKSFTVLSLGTLVDEGKLDWDKPVREYLPSFRLFDPVASERMTPRDLVTHRSGLPRHDPMWYNSTFTRKEMVERLRYLEPSKDFRSAYQYNNLMFMTAGFLAGELSGLPWEQLVRQRILVPLGMKNTNFSVADSKKSADAALPYQKVKEELKEIPFRGLDEMAPAGSINSSIEDMSKYLLMHLNKGKYAKGQIVSESNLTEMHTPQMVVGRGFLRWPELGHSSYGMGWSISSYRGFKLVEHGGAIDGFNALVTFLPQKNVGVVVLVNRGGTPLMQVIAYNVHDRLLKLDQVPWNQRFLDDQKKSEASQEEAKKKGFTVRKEGTKPSHELTEYAGEYEHPGYGVVRIGWGPEGLRLSFNRLGGPLRHFHYDVFEVAEDPLNPLQRTKVNFATNLQGEIDTLAIPLEPSVKEIVFKRMPAKLDRGILESVVGQYQFAGITATVSLRDGSKLFMEVPGQETRELTPIRGLLFGVSGLTGYSIEFKKDASGVTMEAVLYQPNGTFVIKRKN